MFLASPQRAAAAPVKIFILAGQSNMQGHGETSPVTTQGTLEFITANDPEANYQFLKNGTAWTVRNDVWMHYERSPGSLRTGGLAPGFGAAGGNTTSGPELGFGHVVGDSLENQVLLVKCSWGGKSLNFDFSPPSSRASRGGRPRLLLRRNSAPRAPGYLESRHLRPRLQRRGLRDRRLRMAQGWNDQDPGPSAA